jgi:expansin (peptidoglycan-binding protein)
VSILQVLSSASLTLPPSKATVADACPSCTSEYSLDLSTGAFDAIGDEDTGVLDITWYFSVRLPLVLILFRTCALADSPLLMQD